MVYRGWAVLCFVREKGREGNEKAVHQRKREVLLGDSKELSRSSSSSSSEESTERGGLAPKERSTLMM